MKSFENSNGHFGFTCRWFGSNLVYGDSKQGRIQLKIRHKEDEC